MITSKVAEANSSECRAWENLVTDFYRGLNNQNINDNQTKLRFDNSFVEH